MGAKTKIQWCDSTWSPITGCTPVSIGCEHCYAKRLAGRFPQIHCIYEIKRIGDHSQAAIFPSLNIFPDIVSFGKINFHPDRLNIPFHWRKPRRIFICSMGDLFHENVPDNWIDRVLSIVFLCSKHTFQILTKRPERMLQYITSRPQDSIKKEQRIIVTEIGEMTYSVQWPLPNLWLGVTAENQEMFDLRWSIASQIPAAVLFVSGEPLLGGIDFSKYKRKPDWWIVGKETGPGARPINLDWARSLRDQCVSAGVPFFYKNGDLDGQIWNQFPVNKKEVK